MIAGEGNPSTDNFQVGEWVRHVPTPGKCAKGEFVTRVVGVGKNRLLILASGLSISGNDGLAVPHLVRVPAAEAALLELAR